MTVGLTRFHIAGYITCGDHVESRDAVKGIATIFPKKVIATIKEFGSRDEYLTWLTNFREILPAAVAHTTCPIVWTEDESGKMTYFGGENQILKWCRDGSYFDENVPSASSAGSDCCNSKTVQAHDFDYDLIGRFTDAHIISCTDNKGKVQVVTAHNFVIAVGGCPTPLDCPGSEHAITSDDLFMLIFRLCMRSQINLCDCIYCQKIEINYSKLNCAPIAASKYPRRILTAVALLMAFSLVALDLSCIPPLHLYGMKYSVTPYKRRLQGLRDQSTKKIAGKKEEKNPCTPENNFLSVTRSMQNTDFMRKSVTTAPLAKLPLRKADRIHCSQLVDKMNSVPVYWINLEKSSGRREYFENQMKAMGISNRRVVAVTPHDEVVRSSSVQVASKVKHTDAELSCLISHLLAIHKAVYDTASSTRNNPYAIITEDDIEFEMDVDFLTLAQNAPVGFGVLQLTTSSGTAVDSFWEKYKIDIDRKVKNNVNFSKSQFPSTLLWNRRVYDSPFWSCQAYLINKQVVRKFIDRVVSYNVTTGNYTVNIVNPSFILFPCDDGEICKLPYRIVSETYIYSGCHPSYITRVPIFNGSPAGQNTTIHKRKNNDLSHAKNFAQIENVLQNVREHAHILPPYIRVKKCNAPAASASCS